MTTRTARLAFLVSMLLAALLAGRTAFASESTYPKDPDHINFPSGSTYKGEVRYGGMNGKGVYTRFDGERYEGDFDGGRPSGRGVKTWPDGSRYEGEFMHGAFHGQGVYTAADGTRFEGVFTNNRFMSGADPAGIRVAARGNMTDPRYGWSPEPQPYHREFDDYSKAIAGRDLSELFVLTPEGEYLGIIGTDRQRFYIHFTKAEKSAKNPYEYAVAGKTRVKNNICTFSGTMTVELAALQVYDPDIAEFPQYREGMFKTRVELRENPKERGTGVISGHMWTDFAIDDKGVLSYNNLMGGADGFSNNLFVGTWKSYTTGASKLCNFGHCRIPHEGLPTDAHLDVGAGYFSPDSSILSKGWQNYADCMWNNDPAACKEEERHWWK
jgi:Uncharacterized protein conserved in bacteria